MSPLLFRPPGGKGLEPIAVELSGGQFLPPVQKLVATLILPPMGQYANRVPSGVPNEHRRASYVMLAGGEGTNSSWTI